MEGKIEDIDEDALFDHMQKLLDDLPEMEEKGQKLAFARSAEEVLGAASRHKGQKATLDRIDAASEEHVRAREEALAAGDEGRERAEREQILLLGNQRGVRFGAEQSALRELNRILEESPFKNVEEAEAAALSKEDLTALESEIEAFQRDYAETFSACQRIFDVEDEAAVGIEVMAGPGADAHAEAEESKVADKQANR